MYLKILTFCLFLLWYEGFFASIYYNQSNRLTVLKPFSNPFVYLWKICNSFIFSRMAHYYGSSNSNRSNFRYSWYTIGTHTKGVAQLLTAIGGSLIYQIFIVYFGLANIFFNFRSWTLNLVRVHRVFFTKAFAPFFVTWLLVSYFYLVNIGADLKVVKKKRTPLYLWPAQAAALVVYLHSKYTVSPKMRVNLWSLLIERFNDHFFFLKQYYRLNDLIWQDGFLIDFLQKKVVDRWIRGFVIYSGYLFNERFVFDKVVRFYIDYVIWPGYSVSIYEFQSVTNTITITLFILIMLTNMMGLYFLKFVYFL